MCTYAFVFNDLGWMGLLVNLTHGQLRTITKLHSARCCAKRVIIVSRGVQLFAKNEETSGSHSPGYDTLLVVQEYRPFYLKLTAESEI